MRSIRISAHAERPTRIAGWLSSGFLLLAAIGCSAGVDQSPSGGAQGANPGPSPASNAAPMAAAQPPPANEISAMPGTTGGATAEAEAHDVKGREPLPPVDSIPGEIPALPIAHAAKAYSPTGSKVYTNEDLRQFGGSDPGASPSEGAVADRSGETAAFGDSYLTERARVQAEAADQAKAKAEADAKIESMQAEIDRLSKRQAAIAVPLRGPVATTDSEKQAESGLSREDLIRQLEQRKADLNAEIQKKKSGG